MMEKLKKDIAKLSALADGWTEEINPLERELFLDLLRRMYEEVRFGDAPATAACAQIDKLPEVAVATAAVAESVAEEPQEEELVDDEPDFEVELIMSDEEFEDEPAEEESVVPVVEPEVEKPVEQVVEPAPVVDEPQMEPEVKAEPVVEVAPRPKISKSVINSLYGDAELPKVAPSVAAEPAKPVVEQPAPSTQNSTPDVLVTPKTVLGDVINSNAVRLGDSLQTDTMDVATKVAAGSVKSLRDAMGLNDKFVIIRDLFDDDRMRFEVAIDELDSQATFDDAMIYISGFAWNASSEGAKLLMNLLKLKFV